MNIRIQAIHFDATAQLEAFIQKKVSKLEQYFDGIILAEPMVKVVAPIMEAQLVETAILNIMNHQSLIATKAARVCYAAKGDGIMEFGL